MRFVARAEGGWSPNSEDASLFVRLLLPSLFVWLLGCLVGWLVACLFVRVERAASRRRLPASPKAGNGPWPWKFCETLGKGFLEPGDPHISAPEFFDKGKTNASISHSIR